MLFFPIYLETNYFLHCIYLKKYINPLVIAQKKKKELLFYACHKNTCFWTEQKKLNSIKLLS